MELVNKLQELGLLPSDLLHSISGKEYLTQQQLCKEVQQAVAQAGGRFAVVSAGTSSCAQRHSMSMQLQEMCTGSELQGNSNTIF